MKTLAAIKNELFNDYLKIVSTDNLEQTLDNPLVPVPFTCVFSVQNQNSDALVAELNKFFESKKIKNKDFLSLTTEEEKQLSFLFNLISISSDGTKIQSGLENFPILSSKEVEIHVSSEAPPAPSVSVEVESSQELQEESTNHQESEVMTEVEVIESLGIPKFSTIHLIKNEKIVAKIIDDKTIELDNEQLSIIDGTKKAFKQSGVTGMALGLANWNYNGQSLKSLKDNK